MMMRKIETTLLCLLLLVICVAAEPSLRAGDNNDAPHKTQDTTLTTTYTKEDTLLAELDLDGPPFTEEINNIFLKPKEDPNTNSFYQKEDPNKDPEQSSVVTEQADWASVSDPNQESHHADGQDTLHSNYGCALQCIMSGKAFARNEGALVEVKTYTPATITIYLSGPSGGIGPYYSEDGQTSFSQHFTQLEAGTTYSVMAQARDEYGIAIAQGEFTTLSRFLEISFPNEAEIYFNDGWDDAWWSKAVWLNDGWAPGSLEEQMYTTGSNPWLLGPFSHVVSTQVPVDRNLILIFQLEQFGSCGQDFCQWVPDITEWDYPRLGDVKDSGKLFSYAWLNGGESFDLDKRPADATSWLEHTFSVVLEPPHYDLPVYGFAFTIEANIRVMYQKW